MRIGCVYTPRGDWPKWKWVCETLIRMGHEVIRVTNENRLMQADSVCDLMLFEHRDCGIGWRHIRDHAAERKSKWVQWWWDLYAVDELTLDIMLRKYGGVVKLFDRVYFKERPLIGRYRELGINAAYLDQGIPSDWPETTHVADPEFDVLVFGRADGIYQRRVNAVKRVVNANLLVAWATKDGVVPPGVHRLLWCGPRALPELMSHAKCVLCVNLKDIDGYTSDRNWMVTGAGAIPVSNAIEAQAICRMTREERELIGRELRRETLATKTYEHRLRDILRDYESGFVCPVPWEEEVAAGELQGADADAALSGV